MCGRFALKATTKDVEKLVPDLKITKKPGISYNIAPSSQIYAIKKKDDENLLCDFKWGLIPSWAKDESIGLKMINARAETLDEKVSFKRLVNTRRCIIPASGYYEWMKSDTGKIPYYITSSSGDLLCFAGLYDVWKNQNGETIESATIITTEPNLLMAQIHNRMPVIIERSNVRKWIEPKFKFQDLKHLLNPCDYQYLKAYPVSKAFNNPRINSEECLLAIGEELKL